MNRTDSTRALLKAIAEYNVPDIVANLERDELVLFLRETGQCKKCFGRGFKGWLSSAKAVDMEAVEKAPKVGCSCVRKAFTKILRTRRGTGTPSEGSGTTPTATEQPHPHDAQRVDPCGVHA